MATIKQVEGQIAKVEGFEVRIRHGRDGRDVRGDKKGIPKYSYARALKGSKNVRGWREGRFAKSLPGYDVEVVNWNGKAVHGRTLLSTVRDTYLADE